MWIPELVIVNEKVIGTRVTKNVIEKSPNAKFVETASGKSEDIEKIISSVYGYQTNDLDKILLGKKIVYLAPVSSSDIDRFAVDDARLNCPTFHRIKFASNGCPYKCDWCYLKNTFGAKRPYMTIKAELDKLYSFVEKKVQSSKKPIMFNCGELNDSLALEHLSLFAQTFIPRFARLSNGYLYLLTKTDNVDSILKLPHANKTTIGWSLNAPIVSQHFELGAPPLEKRLEAAQKAVDAGYPIRIRLDPILKFPGWEQAYATTIDEIFRSIKPTRITLGTLRFEEGFFRQKDYLFANSAELLPIVNKMEPMFSPMALWNGKTSIGKYSLSEQDRIEIFRFAIQEVRKYTDRPIALCKESSSVWAASGIDLSKIECVCLPSHTPRMITTSYYGMLKHIDNPVCISQGKMFQNERIKDYLKLAPSWSLVNRHTAGTISKEDYATEYTRDVLSRLNPQEVMNEIIALFGRDATLLCHEDPDKFCHRHLVAGWLEKGTGIAVPELKF